MRNVSLLILASVLLVACDKPADPKVREAELKAVQTSIKEKCRRTVTLEWVAAVVGPSPVDVQAKSDQLCKDLLKPEPAPDAGDRQRQ